MRRVLRVARSIQFLLSCLSDFAYLCARVLSVAHLRFWLHCCILSFSHVRFSAAQLHVHVSLSVNIALALCVAQMHVCVFMSVVFWQLLHARAQHRVVIVCYVFWLRAMC